MKVHRGSDRHNEEVSNGIGISTSGTLFDEEANLTNPKEADITYRLLYLYYLT